MPDHISSSRNKPPKWLVIFCLILAGEMIFSLPFHVPRFFRPTLLEVLDMSNTQFGNAFAFYGIMAMLSYFPGGVLADRFSARKLITVSLLATGSGGFLFALMPKISGLSFLFGYWGVTTVFLFWASMIRTTREWGGHLAQGKAFGLLDGGRGLVSAGAATLAVVVMTWFMPEEVSAVTQEERTQAMRSVIYFYSIATLATSILTWFFIPETSQGNNIREKISFQGIAYAIRNKAVWLQAVIVICAYAGYKGLDFYTSYAVDILGMDEVSAARYMSLATYLRPVSAIGFGILADRISAGKVISIMFTLSFVAYLGLSRITPQPATLSIIYLNLITTFIAVFALRGVYFALLEETDIKGKYTGTAVGLISVVGFAPDAFFYAAGGRIIDAAPGLSGFHNYFIFLAAFALTGFISILILRKTNYPSRKTESKPNL